MFGEKIIKKAGDDVDEAAVKPNFKMPPESLQDKMYRQHQEIRKQRGAPSAEEYKQRIAQKQKEIDALKEAHPNQQAALYNPDGPTYRQQKMPGYDIDDIYSRGQVVDLDPEVGDINAPEDHLDAAEKANLKKILKQYTDRLSPLQRNVIFLRYWDDHTLESAGKILGVTPERVRQIEARAMRYIRQYDKENSKDLLGLSKRKTYEGILDRAMPKMPKPRNPADQVLRGKVNAAGKHLDKKRRQELAPKHKHQDPLAEGEVLQFPKSPEDKNVRAKLEQRLLAAFNQIVDYAEDNGIDILEKNAPLYSKLFDKYDTEDATLDPEQAIARNEPIEVVTQVVKEVLRTNLRV